MKMVIIRVKNQYGERRQFTLGAVDLGVVLDMAYGVVELVDDITITLKDKNITINLPGTVFKGQSFEVCFNQLKSEWDQLLGYASPKMTPQIELRIKVLQSRIDQNKRQIAFLESTIVSLELRLGNHTADSAYSIRYQQLIDGYRLLLENNQAQIEKSSQQLRILLN